MVDISLLEFLLVYVAVALPDILNKWVGRKECEKRCKQDPLAPAQYKRCPMWDCYAYKGCPHGGLYDLKNEKDSP